MGRIVLFLVLALVAYIIFKGAFRRDRRPHAGAEGAESMVACHHCRLNVPTSEALLEGGHYYCSEEHRRLGAG